MKPIRHALIFCVILAAFSSLSGCGGDSGAVDAGPPIDAPPEVGTLSLQWEIENAGAPLDCAQVVGLNVSVTAIPREGGIAVPEVFGCDAMSGTSAPVNAGLYNVEVGLRTSGNQPLADTLILPGVDIATGQNTDLGLVVFDVVPQGNIEFVVDAGFAGGNCQDTGNGGAGITELSFEFRGSDNQCVPTTFDISDGANQTGGTYVADCNLARYPCIDSDQVVRAAGVASGESYLQITGYQGVDECYERNSQFPVPGADITTELVPQTLSPIGVCAMP